jgi:hypothetical protein
VHLVVNVLRCNLSTLIQYHILVNHLVFVLFSIIEGLSLALLLQNLRRVLVVGGVHRLLKLGGITEACRDHVKVGEAFPIRSLGSRITLSLQAPSDGSSAPNEFLWVLIEASLLFLLRRGSG